MGGRITKILDPPVDANEWDSLQKEAVRIRMSLVGLIQDMEKWSNNDYEQRYSLIRLQWQIIYPMLLQVIKKGHVRNIGESVEWCKHMREEIYGLANRYTHLSIKKTDEKEEPLLMDDNDSFLVQR
jgi:hypothetical protein